jgi:hypothetical protein
VPRRSKVAPAFARHGKTYAEDGELVTPARPGDFTPIATGTRTDLITLSDNGDGAPLSFNVAGTGTAPTTITIATHGIKAILHQHGVIVASGLAITPGRREPRPHRTRSRRGPTSSR